MAVYSDIREKKKIVVNMESVADMVNRLSSKVDLLIDTLPQRYVPRTDFDPWRLLVDTRLKGLEDSQMLIRDNITRRNEEATRWTLQTIKEIDAKIDARHQTVLDKLDQSEDKIDTAARIASEQRVSRMALFISILFGGVGAAVTIANYVGLHYHP